MLTFFLKKVALLIPTFIGVTLIAFTFIRVLPGDPIELLAGERGISDERHAALMAEFGFDQPIWQQYFSFLNGILHGDFGESFVTKQPVLSEFIPRFSATLELGICALLFAIVIGIPAGTVAAVKRGSKLDHIIMSFSLTGYSMPIFWWGLLMIMFFSGYLGLTPVSGRIDAMIWLEPTTGFMLIDTLLFTNEPGAFTSALSHLVLPSIVLGTMPLAVIARQTRSAMLEVLDEDYVRTARAKGLSAFRVVGIHALRNAMITLVTVIGLQVGVLMAGAILTESVFSWPGIGKWMVDSIFRRDYFVVQGGLVLIVSIIMVVNLVVDLLYGLINPRIVNN
ncbi:ABC transporter permease subunit [Aurantivibrio plasticivorans]